MNRIIQGDCLEVMQGMEAASVDAIVTDPPYGLAFMGKEWDRGVPGEPFWAEAHRVAKPGTWLLAMGGTRTFHRLACAIEDAGWEIRDCLMWIYGQGFPKSHNGTWGGTALKPAWEPIIMARKPLVGTVAENVQRHGTGGVNVDGCRLEPSGPPSGWSSTGSKAGPNIAMSGANYERAAKPDNPLGRWPANVCLDEEAAAMLDEQSGKHDSPRANGNMNMGANSAGWGGPRIRHDFQDRGGASRFFYVAKASRREREAGLRDAPNGKRVFMGSSGRSLKDGKWVETHSVPLSRTNHHPCVKPISLMRWLCRLVTPKGGIILDPFAGSGSTGCAAVAEGFNFIGIEKQEEYVTIARARVDHWYRTTEPNLPMPAAPAGGTQ